MATISCLQPNLGFKLNHEIELYEASSPADLVAWVNIPFVSSTADTTLYMYYGNAGAAPQENPSDVWDSNYVMVQHLDETSGIHYDSTSYSNEGTVWGGVNQAGIGQIDGADEFDGSDDYVRVPNADSWDLAKGASLPKPGSTHLIYPMLVALVSSTTAEPVSADRLLDTN